MERLGEVPFEDPAGDGGDEARIGGEGGLHVGRELRPDVVRPQFGDSGDVGAFLGLQAGRGVDGPDAVALEPPEGLLGVVRLPGRPELAQQGGEVRLDLAERDVLLARSATARGRRGRAAACAGRAGRPASRCSGRRSASGSFRYPPVPMPLTDGGDEDDYPNLTMALGR